MLNQFLPARYLNLPLYLSQDISLLVMNEKKNPLHGSVIVVWPGKAKAGGSSYLTKNGSVLGANQKSLSVLLKFLIAASDGTRTVTLVPAGMLKRDFCCPKHKNEQIRHATATSLMQNTPNSHPALTVT